MQPLTSFSAEPSGQAQRDIVVTGTALRSALGNLESTWTRLLAGESAVRSRSLFAEIPTRPLATIGERAIELEELLDCTLADLSGQFGELWYGRDCAVSVGSSRGMQRACEVWLRDRCAGYKETKARLPWLTTLPHTPALYVARSIGSKAAVFAPMAACATGLWAIARAYLALQDGTCDRAIAGAVEAPISPLTIATFDRMGALSPDTCRPFDRARSGMVLGEGAALLVIESQQSAERRRAKIWGRIAGVGMTADAHHMSAPDPNIASARAAVMQCLRRAAWEPESVDYIHLHGTGTRLNDLREAELVQSIFPQGVAVSSTKGATGHTVGASGAIGAVLCLQAIATQTVPPCVGLQDLEFDIDCVQQARSQRVDRTLCFSFGFGGQNVVLALERAAPVHGVLS